jgi:hypothetical protein
MYQPGYIPPYKIHGTIENESLKSVFGSKNPKIPIVTVNPKYIHSIPKRAIKVLKSKFLTFDPLSNPYKGLPPNVHYATPNISSNSITTYKPPIRNFVKAGILEIDINQDDCNFIAQSSLNFGGFKFTGGKLIVRASDCIPPISPPPVTVSENQSIELNLPDNANSNSLIIVQNGESLYYGDGNYFEGHNYYFPAKQWRYEFIKTKILKVEYPIIFNGIQYGVPFTEKGSKITVSFELKTESLKSLSNLAWIPEELKANKVQTYTYTVWSQTTDPAVFVWNSFFPYVGTALFRLQFPASVRGGLASSFYAERDLAFIWQGNNNNVARFISDNRYYQFTSSYTKTQTFIPEPGLYFYFGETEIIPDVMLGTKTPVRQLIPQYFIDNNLDGFINGTVSYSTLFINKINWIIAAFNDSAEFIEPPPPPPDKKDKEDKMACCPEHTRLLRQILKKLGDADLPASVPTLLTRPDSGTTQIENLAQFISYTVKQLDALAGKYPIDIQIEDSDLTQEGNQTQEVKIANIAEALGEILGILLILRSESDATLSATVRGMIESGSAKQAASLAVDYAKANAEYLGYKGKQSMINMPMAFNPREERLDVMLHSTEIQAKSWENEDKQDLNDYLAPLLEFAAMWKAQNFRKTGADDPSGVIRTILRNSGNFINAIDYFTDNPPPPSNQDPDAPPPPKPINKWDQTLEDIEQGFINKSGISDTLHPYGRELERRPRIREIGTDTGNEP